MEFSSVSWIHNFINPLRPEKNLANRFLKFSKKNLSSYFSKPAQEKNVSSTQNSLWYLSKVQNSFDGIFSRNEMGKKKKIKLESKGYKNWRHGMASEENFFWKKLSLELEFQRSHWVPNRKTYKIVNFLKCSQNWILEGSTTAKIFEIFSLKIDDEIFWWSLFATILSQTIHCSDVIQISKKIVIWRKFIFICKFMIFGKFFKISPSTFRQ